MAINDSSIEDALYGSGPATDMAGQMGAFVGESGEFIPELGLFPEPSQPTMQDQMGAFVKPAFLSQYQEMYPEGFGQGFYGRDRLNKNLGTTGKPQTQQELDYILQFREETGQLPTSAQTGAWKAEQGFGKVGKGAPTLDYLPESTMAQLGFETGEQADVGRQYGLERGPQFGGAANFATTPVQDAQGNIIGYADSSQQAANAVIQGMRGGPDRAASAPQQAAGFQQPEFQDLVDKELHPLQQYSYRVKDYLGSMEQQELEASKTQEFVNSNNEPLSPEAQELHRQQAAKQIAAKYDEAHDKAIKAAQGGIPVEQLPFFQESQNLNAGLTAWYNQRIPQLSEEFAGGVALDKKLGDRAQAISPQLTGTQPLQQRPIQGATFSEFSGYIAKLKLTPKDSDWMRSNYSDFIQRWEASGDPNFGSWLGEYLASGGK